MPWRPVVSAAHGAGIQGGCEIPEKVMAIQLGFSARAYVLVMLNHLSGPTSSFDSDLCQHISFEDDNYEPWTKLLVDATECPAVGRQ